MADRTGPSRRAALATVLAALAALVALAGCGGRSTADPSAREEVTAVARAYNQAFVARDGAKLCALMTSSLRRAIVAPTGQPRPATCATLLSFASGTVRAASDVHPVVLSVRVSGSRATATIRTSAGVGVLPLARQGDRWRVNGTVRYVRRVYLKADYRLTRAHNLSASSVAGILVQRAQAIIGTPVQARALGADEISLTVAEPVRSRDLALVTRPQGGRLAFYDWEANALTPAGRGVGDRLRSRDPSALLISQGSGAEPPGTGAGAMSLHDAVKLAGRQRPRGWMVVRAWAPVSAAGKDAPEFYVLRDRPALSRADIEGAFSDTDPLGNPDVVVDLTPRGVRQFQRLTADLARRGAVLSSSGLTLDQHIAAVLDGKLLSVVYVDFNAHPHGILADDGAQITGGFSPATAQELAAEIGAPPLPATLQLIRSTTFSRRVG